MKDRTILHCDCNGFYASVECLFRPELKNVPMAVSGDADQRHGIILAKNELAKKYQIQTAETIWEAKRKCPELVLVRPHREAYVKYSVWINEIYQEYTDLVEPFGIDESWLDVTASEQLFGDGKTIADTLRKRIQKELGLTISVGVSFNKIFAKLGSDYRKPNATTVISRENYRNIVWSLPVSALLFVGHSVEHTLHGMGIHTIGDLAFAEQSVLEKQLGKAGSMLHRYARGEDDSPVASVYDQKEAKSIGNGMTFRRDLISERDIYLGVMAIADLVATRLRKHHKKCYTIQVIVKDAQFQMVSRQKTLMTATNLAKELEDTAMELIRKHWKIGRPIRMISIQATHLCDEQEILEQMNLFQEETEQKRKQENLEKAIDKIRLKFGKGAITKLSMVQNDIGIEMENKQASVQNGKKDRQ